MIAFFRFVLVAMMLVAVASLAAIITMQFAIHGAEVKVPDFRGMTVAEARQSAASLGVNFKVDNHFYSLALERGRVVSQAPEPGAVVRREWDVRVADSLGPQRIAIPQALGQPERLATIAIRRVGLELGTVGHMPNALVTAGTVISQDPQPNAAGAERPSVSILVADPDPTLAVGYVMPDDKGHAYASAAAELEHAGLKVEEPKLAPASATATAPTTVVVPTAGALTVGGTASAPTAPAIAAGTILAQSPAAGERVDGSTPIIFTVSQ